jgi:hypothetical protein
VDSRPDALIHKARIAIQTQLFGLQSAIVQTRAQQIWKLGVEDQPSKRPSLWSGCTKPYMEIACKERVTVRTTKPHRLDAALKQERFSVKNLKISITQLSVRTAHDHRPDGARIYQSSRPFEPSAYK